MFGIESFREFAFMGLVDVVKMMWIHCKISVPLSGPKTEMFEIIIWENTFLLLLNDNPMPYTVLLPVGFSLHNLASSWIVGTYYSY